MHDAADPVRQQLGWYMRNCAKSAAAIRLEFVLLERLNVLKGNRRIMPRSSLLGGGLLTINDDGTDVAGRCGLLQLAPPLRKTMFRPYHSREEWAEDVFGAPLPADLEWSDYDYLGDARDLTAALLAGAAKRNAEGVNILIYGPVGTGKTEFCKVLAAQCGLNLWSVGEADEQGGEPTRLERLASMRLAHRLLKCRRNTAILFDEAEDLLAQDGGSLFGLKVRGRNGSKVHINRVIEQNPVPVLWTCNDVDCMDPAVLRRMTLAIEITTPNRAVRARIWHAGNALPAFEGRTGFRLWGFGL